MKPALVMALLCAVAAPATAQSASPAQITLKSPEDLFGQLREMGYAPDPFDQADIPSTVIRTQDGNLAVIMGGCKQRRNCGYLVVSAIYTDVKSPPAKWVAERNADYDLIKVWVNTDGYLTYSAGFLAEGMDRATFRSWIDNIIASGTALAQQVVKDGLVKP